MKLFLVSVFALATFIGIASQSLAGPVSIFQIANPGTGGVAGTTTNDIKINAPPGVLIGSMEILVQLTQGTIYEHPLGMPSPFTNNPPGIAFLPIDPSIAFDSFLSAGQATDTNPLILGPSLRLGGPNEATAVFNATTYNSSHGPPLGQDNSGRTGYLAARLTLSNNANGTFKFRVDFSNNTSWGSGFGQFGTLPIGVGVLLPEPATMSLMGLAGCGVVGFVRRRRNLS